MFLRNDLWKLDVTYSPPRWIWMNGCSASNGEASLQSVVADCEVCSSVALQSVVGALGQFGSTFGPGTRYLAPLFAMRTQNALVTYGER